MFSGIITEIGQLRNITSDNTKDVVMTIAVPYRCGLPKLEIGASVACSGICLTLVKKELAPGFFAKLPQILLGKNCQSFWLLDFQLSAETLQRSTAKSWRAGELINIEFALKIGDELGGHLVTGHIDGEAQIVKIEKSVESHIFLVKAPENLRKFIAPKGSVTLNGVSLTVNETQKEFFTVNIIPHTLEHTNFRNLKIGDALNLEVDIVARYLHNLRANNE